MIIHESEVISITMKRVRDTNYLIFEIKEGYSNYVDETTMEKMKKDLASAYSECYINKTVFAQIYRLQNICSNNIFSELKYLYNYIEFLKTFNYMFQECNIATGIIIESSVVKNVFNGLLMLYHNVKPVKGFEHEVDARNWIGEVKESSDNSVEI